MAGRKRTRGAAVVVALSFLVLTGAAVVVVARAEAGRAIERRSDDARAASLRAADAIQTLLGTLDAQVQNGTANPRLMAALDARVDATTLGDLLLNEPWWESFRRAVDGFGLYGADAQPIVASRLPVGFDARTIVREARQAGLARASLGVAGAEGCWSPRRPSRWRAGRPSRRWWRCALSTPACSTAPRTRASAALAISDGHQLLVTSTAGPDRRGRDGAAALAAALALPVWGGGPSGGHVVARAR